MAICNAKRSLNQHMAESRMVDRNEVISVWAPEKDDESNQQAGTALPFDEPYCRILR